MIKNSDENTSLTLASLSMKRSTVSSSTGKVTDLQNYNPHSRSPMKRSGSLSSALSCLRGGGKNYEAGRKPRSLRLDMR